MALEKIDQAYIVDFIMIGAMKAGSTTLADYLANSSEVCFSSNKEPQYFSRHFDDWSLQKYHELWSDPSMVCGEGSTCYSRWPKYQGVAKRIYEYNPKMKFVYILRHPIKRAYSHYVHNVVKGEFDYKSFDDALEKSDEIITSSQYMLQLKEYLQYFPAEQFLLVDFDDMVRSNHKVLNDIEEFLGVEKSEATQLETKHSNMAGKAASVGQVRKKIDKIRKLPVLKQLIDILFSRNMRSKIRKVITDWIKNSKLTTLLAKRKVKQFDKLNDEHIAYLSPIFESDIMELEQFWGRDLSHWRFLETRG